MTDTRAKESAADAATGAEEARALARRRYRVQAFAGGMGIGIGLAVVVTSSFLGDILNVRSPVLMLFGISLVGASTASILSLYLRGRLSGAPTQLNAASSLDTQARQELLSALDQVRSAANRLSENTVIQLPAHGGESDIRLLASRAVFSEARKRLSEKAALLERRARVNLVIGSSTSVAAIVTLIAFAFSPVHLSAISWQQLLSMYLPKFGVVLMLEVFAFFFLRLYKATLADSRLLDGELDALALKEAALLAAWSDEPLLRVDFAKSLIASVPASVQHSEKRGESLDPKLVAEMASAIAKLARG